MRYISKITAVISAFLPAWILSCAIIGFLVPQWFNPIQNWTGFCLGIIFLLMGMSLSPAQMWSVIRKPKHAFIGFTMKWVIMVGVTIVLAFTFFHDQAELASGLILSGTVPSGTSANVYTFIGGGEVALSITMATLDTIVSPFLTPGLVELSVGKLIPIDFWALFFNIGLIVFLPLFLGFVLQRIFPQSVQKVSPYTSVLSQIALFVVVLSVISKAQPALAGNLNSLPLIFAAVILQVSIPMAAGYWLARWAGIARQHVIAITFHTGICNTALSATLAMEHISSLAAVPAVANMVVNLTIGAIVAKRFEKNSIAASVAEKAG